jgi:hypothetical protein
MIRLGMIDECFAVHYFHLYCNISLINIKKLFLKYFIACLWQVETSDHVLHVIMTLNSVITSVGSLSALIETKLYNVY